MYFCTPRCFIRDFRIEDIPTVMTYRNDLEWEVPRFQKQGKSCVYQRTAAYKKFF